MSGSAWRRTANLVAAILAIFNLRRAVFTLAAIARHPHPRTPKRLEPPSTLVLVPCRDEAATLPGLIDRLDRLDYPARRLCVVLIDDGSRDQTRAVMRLAVEKRPGWRLLSLDAGRGKAQAMNEALARVAFGEVVAVYDADHRPEPGSLRRLVAAFDDPSVAGASGRTIPANATTSLPAYYAAVESMVHQMITMRAKDRLRLAPALLGSNCAYRRSALAEVGGFRPGTLLEDSDLTLALARRGYRLRFLPDAVAWHQSPVTVDGYVQQHGRWARGFHDVARRHVRAVLLDGRIPLRLRVELAMFSLGYLDRLALLAAAALKAAGVGCERAERRGTNRLSRPASAGGGWLSRSLQLALIMPLVQVIAALLIDRAPRGLWLRLPAVPLLFALDILVAARAALESLLNRPRVWAVTERPTGSASQQTG